MKKTLVLCLVSTVHLLFVVGAIAQDNILDVRENFTLGQMVTVSGVITTDENLGSVRYMQDATAAIVIYPGFDWSEWNAVPAIGDSMVVTGELTEYNGLLEVGPNLAAVEFFGQTSLPEPLDVLPSDFGEELEGVFAKVDDVVFQSPGAVVVGNNTYEFSVGGQVGVMYVRTSNALVGTNLPACGSNLLGVISQFSFTGTDGYQFLPLEISLSADEDGDGLCDCNLDECGVCDGPGAIYDCGCVDLPPGFCDCEGNQLDAVGECGGSCSSDINSNGVCDDLEVYGCTYVEAQNFNPQATSDDGSCQLEATCIPACDLVYDGNEDGIVGSGDLLGLLTEFGAECSTPETAFTCGDPVSYQGYDYATVLIGEQCWFAENLRSDNYENGDAIPTSLSDSDWQNTTSGAVAVYGEGASSCGSASPDGDACDEAWSLNEYGRLYNWYAVDDARGLCPGGWHVPTDGEWTVMTDFLGGEFVAGGQMKTTYGWFAGGNATNSSGFLGLPGSYRNYAFGGFSDAGRSGYWWSSSPSGSNAWLRDLYHDTEYVDRWNGNPSYGFSVRCIKDSE